MDKFEILKTVDHTLLKPTATWEEIKVLCDEAIAYKTASVCIPPSYVKGVFDEYGNKINICTVIGFPLGYASTESKVAEIRKALEDGASEFDMVINLTQVKNNSFETVTSEIAALKREVGDLILKVIVETCYLEKEEKIQVCKCVTEGGGDYIKTSTGFGSGGAVLEDIHLFKEHIGKSVKIKASGGIRTEEDMIDFLKAGCSRLGTSAAIKILN